jgi:hypothetical protein
VTRRLAVNALLVVVVAFAAYKNFEKRIHHSMTADEPRNGTQAGKVLIAFGDGHAKTLARGFGAPMQDMGVDDERASASAARVDKLAETKPNFVVVTAGSADLDGHVPLDETLRALDTNFSHLQDAGALVAYLPIEPKPEVGDNWIMAIEQLCKERHVLVAPGVRVDQITAEVAADRVHFALDPYL